MNRTRAWLTVFRAGFLQTAGSPGVWAMVATCVLSSFASIFHNYQGHLEELDHYAVELQERQRLQLRTRTGPSDRETDRSLRVLRPPSPAATFVVGVERTMPAGWDFGPAGVETLAPYAGREPLAAFDMLTDGESVVRLFGGMLAIGLGFWTITRDRQRGWLAAAPWLPLPHWWVLSALLAAGLASLAVIALVWIAGSVMFTLWLLGAGANVTIVFADTWLLAWIYLATMFGIGALIARITMNTLVGMATVVATWTVLIFLGPQLLATVVRMSSAIPPRVRLEQERRERYADRHKAAVDAFANSLGALVPYGMPRSQVSPFFTDGFPRFEPAWREAMRQARQEADAINREWLDARVRWTDRLQTIARFTPGTLLQSALATANGQSWATHRRWEDAITRHETALNRALYDDRSALTLEIPWNGTVLLWGNVWHRLKSHAELPQFDVAALLSASDKRGLASDVAAGLSQLAIVLLFAASVRPRS